MPVVRLEAYRDKTMGRHVRGGHVERLKRGLSHVLSVCLGFQWSFREQHGKQGAQYFYPALGWRLRSHRGGRGRPERSTTRVYSEVATPFMGATHI